MIETMNNTYQKTIRHEGKDKRVTINYQPRGGLIEIFSVTDKRGRVLDIGFMQLDSLKKEIAAKRRWG